MVRLLKQEAIEVDTGGSDDDKGRIGAAYQGPQRSAVMLEPVRVDSETSSNNGEDSATEILKELRKKMDASSKK